MSVFDATSGVSYSTLSDAISHSIANDVIQLSAGTHTENFPSITDSLTIESVGGMAYLSNPWLDKLDYPASNNRAVINVPANWNVNLTLRGLDISGAVNDVHNPPAGGGANGAGVLFETGNGALLIDSSHIHHNEDGVLVGATATGHPKETVTITNSEIDHNGASIGNADAASMRAGRDHNIYIGDVTQFTLTNSYIHDALDQGHEIKSRAQATTITNNQIFDNSSNASYEIDLPNGGQALVQGNIIGKGHDSVQNAVVDCGAEGSYTGSELTFTGTTVINDAAHLGSPTLMYNWCATTVSANQLFGLFNLGENKVSTASLTTLNNQMQPLTSAPALDTNSPFVPQAAPEPDAFGLVLTSLLAMATLRRRRRSLSIMAGR
ncbi:MAG: hypothetical protein ACJ8AW_26440 [Rhodopila sp.]